jgi:hypothetical protein
MSTTVKIKYADVHLCGLCVNDPLFFEFRLARQFQSNMWSPFLCFCGNYIQFAPYQLLFDISRHIAKLNRFNQFQINSLHQSEQMPHGHLQHLMWSSTPFTHFDYYIIPTYTCSLYLYLAHYLLTLCKTQILKINSILFGFVVYKC